MCLFGPHGFVGTAQNSKFGNFGNPHGHIYPLLIVLMMLHLTGRYFTAILGHLFFVVVWFVEVIIVFILLCCSMFGSKL